MKDITDVVEWCTIGEFEKRFDLPHGTIRDKDGRVFRRDKKIGILPKEGNEIASFVLYTSGKKPNRKEATELSAMVDKVRHCWSDSSDDKED